MKRIITIAVLALSLKTGAQTLVAEKAGANIFTLVGNTGKTVIYTESNDDWLVQKSAELLQQDIEKVSGHKPEITHNLQNISASVIAIGSVDGSAFIRQTLQSKKLLQKIQNKWDGYLIQSVKNPVKGIGNMLVIAGSNKRGAAYGAFEISKQIGVSPWYWWADVPVKKRSEILINAAAKISDTPSVKYRGIFINDEAPAFSGWTRQKFGGVNHNMYEHMFELLLRLKGNYLWPAMWGNAFNDDDTLNPVMADKWGIVMGTSHHEPMLRAQQEWKRYGKGPWDYTKNDTTLRSFWKKGIQNMGSHESIVTVGMRGDGDLPMTQGTATELLERVVADQRKIIAEVTGKSPEHTPQAWALYKEVQDYYDKGMRVPDDVTLLLCDDNWGNLRKLPKPTDKPRSGGYGIYYHFDYVGGPRNYKWINTNNIPRVWEQMNLAYNSGVDRIWVVNVGDLKPMEFPISFFLDHAWNAKRWTDKMPESYYAEWASAQFGEAQARPIGNLLRKYSQYSARIKPELLNANTFSLQNYDEWQKVLTQMQTMRKEAETAGAKLPAEYTDAYFQLVLHPVKALTNLYELYHAVAMNRDLAQRSDLRANLYADSVKLYYQRDSMLSREYNNISGGKWNHMMDQTHIGYTSWQEPRTNVMPQVRYLNPDTIKEIMAWKATTGSDGSYVSIAAADYKKAVDGNGIVWKVIGDIGKEGDGITAFPVTKSVQVPAANTPHLEYAVNMQDTGMVKVLFYFSPTLPFNNTGLKYAVSVDNEQPEIINLHKDYNERIWNQWVANNNIVQSVSLRIKKKGPHTLKYWLLDPAIVLQKIVVDFGGVKPAYFGAPAPQLIN